MFPLFHRRHNCGGNLKVNIILKTNIGNSVDGSKLTNRRGFEDNFELGVPLSFSYPLDGDDNLSTFETLH